MPTTAPHSLLPSSPGIESSPFTNTEGGLEISKTSSENDNTSSVDEQYDDEKVEEKFNEADDEDGIIEGPPQILADPLDIALEADSHHSSAESEVDREEDCDDAATYDNFLCV